MKTFYGPLALVLAVPYLTCDVDSAPVAGVATLKNMGAKLTGLPNAFIDSTYALETKWAAPSSDANATPPKRQKVYNALAKFRMVPPLETTSSSRPERFDREQGSDTDSRSHSGKSDESMIAGDGSGRSSRSDESSDPHAGHRSTASSRGTSLFGDASPRLGVSKSTSNQYVESSSSLVQKPTRSSSLSSDEQELIPFDTTG
ncbi:hypothetical protein CXG81DRAFT_21328 [Caulochytrium protostelioides]|uniref:Uncharacterized protein n=1 Tax=Caulochytrium protostelioides TaxID=1555241 RepID=A0A4P9WY62_9FUNG|nr:hypothetical protein CXG81DRAFT_21328 [Caulochytrium protostelioides]|eukprot:RKO98439.1 hypothetical protein CXG81DRAFT_21328 [Caulochytrium protostelioides]